MIMRFSYLTDIWLIEHESSSGVPLMNQYVY